jgi:hypothetical protein
MPLEAREGVAPPLFDLDAELRKTNLEIVNMKQTIVHKTHHV